MDKQLKQLSQESENGLKEKVNWALGPRKARSTLVETDFLLSNEVYHDHLT